MNKPISDKNTRAMLRAMALAEQAAAKNEIPVGAVLLDSDGVTLAEAYNLSETHLNPMAHAEMLVLQQAIANGRRYFDDCTLAVTLEPCAMCMGAICAVRVGTLVFGAYDEKSGGTVHGARVADHAHFKPTILGGIMEEPCRNQLQTFFQSLRDSVKDKSHVSS